MVLRTDTLSMASQTSSDYSSPEDNHQFLWIEGSAFENQLALTQAWMLSQAISLLWRKLNHSPLRY